MKYRILAFVVLAITLGCGAQKKKNDKNENLESDDSDVESIDQSTPYESLQSGIYILMPDGTLTHESQSATINSRTVNLTIKPTSDATQMKISEDNTFTSADWTPVAKTMQYTFTSDGKKNLYIKFSNFESIESQQFSASISIQLFPASSKIVIADGSGTSKSRSVDVEIEVPQNAIYMSLSESTSFVSTIWVPVSEFPTFTFSSIGISRLYAKFKDINSLESQIYSSNFINISIFDAQEGGISINNGNPTSNSRTVNVTVTKPTNGTQMILCENPSFQDCIWEISVLSKILVFNSDGIKSLFVKFKDNFGFESEISSSSISINTTVPTFSLSSSYNGRDENMAITISPSDVTSITEIKIGPSSTFSSQPWQPFLGTKHLAYSSSIKVQIKDYWGNDSEIQSFQVRYTPSLSFARYFGAAVTVGNEAVFAGGAGPDTGSCGAARPEVDIYNSISNTWAVSSMLYGRCMPAFGAIGSKAYFAGGGRTHVANSTVEIYDTLTKAWTTSALSSSRSGMAAASIGTKIFFAGGRDLLWGGADQTTVDIYDQSTSTWTQSNLSVGRTFLASAKAGDNKILFAGGLSGVSSSSTVDIYDATTQAWTTTSLSRARNNLVGASVGNKAIFAGGEGGENIVDIYDAISDTWSSTTLSVGRIYLGAATIGDKVYFVGGHAGAQGYSNVVDVYDSISNTWSTLSLSQGRAGPLVTSMGSLLFVAGGQIPAMSSIEIYDSSTGTWGSQL